MTDQKSAVDFDIVIVGAGISGINFAYRLQERNPELSFIILEGRNDIGGTWSLFQYPGIRSDSDLFTFGFPWRPWQERASIAEGHKILAYMRECMTMYGIDKKIRFRHHVNTADWSSSEKNWTLSLSADGIETTMKSRYVLMCTGYYDYSTPLRAAIPGLEDFKGRVVHPQFWPEDLDYTDKKVSIIGSGATAITLLPALAEKAQLVTMVQRSPSYVMSQPREDALERLIRAWVPTRWVHAAIRFKWLAVPFLFINFCRLLPGSAKALLQKAAKAQLPPQLAIDPHFNPRYNPFEQRMCFCPDGDFYRALRKGKANVVTGRIETVTANSIKLDDGRGIPSDVIVTATGLKIQLAGGMQLSVDGAPLQVSRKYLWKNIMLEDLPNLFFVIGYVDASWTLGADATAQLVCRMLNIMKKQGRSVATPRMDAATKARCRDRPVLKLSSTYVSAAKDSLPKVCDQPQWQARTTYFRDIWEAWFGNINKGIVYNV